MRRRDVLILSVLTVAQALARAQAPAARPSEVFLVPFEEGPKKTTQIGFLTIQREGKKAGKPVNISNNAAGDDNEPRFLPDSSGVIFISARGGAASALHRYDIASKELAPATPTPDNLPAHTAAVPLSPTRVAIVSVTSALQLIDPTTGSTETIEPRAGRSLALRPERGTITFTRKADDGGVWIKELDPSTRAIRLLTEAVDGSELIAWTPKGTLVTAAGAKLFFWEAEDDRWIPFGDLKDVVQGITRLAVSPDGNWIAVVGQPKK